MSFIICSFWEFDIFLSCKDLITVAESPSKTEFQKPTSIEKITARRAANNSTVSTVGGFIIFSERAAITSPLQIMNYHTKPRFIWFPKQRPIKINLSPNFHLTASMLMLLLLFSEVAASVQTWLHNSRDSLQQTLLFCPKEFSIPELVTCFDDARLPKPWMQKEEAALVLSELAAPDLKNILLQPDYYPANQNSFARSDGPSHIPTERVKHLLNVWSKDDTHLLVEWFSSINLL